MDYYGQPKELKAEGMMATCIQHEINHLDGRLIIDFLSKLKRDVIIKKLSKKTILVTGAAGTIGSEICRQLIQHNVKKIIDILLSNFISLDIYNLLIK